MKFCTLCRRDVPVGASICSYDGHPLTEDIPIVPAPGDTVGGYSIVDVVAHGDAGTVYRATDSSGSRVALKILDSELCATASVLHRVRRETKNAIKLASPNVARILDCGDHDGRFFVVREWIDGHPLSVAIHEEQPMPVGRVAAIAYQVSAALALVHRVGLVHRDLKPNHIIIGRNGDSDEWIVKLIDIGVAAKVQGIQVSRDVFGTLEYLSPEQAEGKLVSFRSDLYSLGCIVYELLTGAPLFQGTPQEIIDAHKAHEPPDVMQLRPEIPPAFSQLISKLLSKQASARPFSAAMVQRELERAVPECKQPLAPVAVGRGGVASSAPRASAPPVAAPQAGEDMAMAETLFGANINADDVKQAIAGGPPAPTPAPAAAPVPTPAPAAAPTPPIAPPGAAVPMGGGAMPPNAPVGGSSAKQTILGLPVVSPQNMQAGAGAAQPGGAGFPPPPAPPVGQGQPAAPPAPVEVAPDTVQGQPPASPVQAPVAPTPEAPPAPQATPQPGLAKTFVVDGSDPAVQQQYAASMQAASGAAPQPGAPQMAGMNQQMGAPAQEQPPTTEELTAELKKSSSKKILLIVVIGVILLFFLMTVLGTAFCMCSGAAMAGGSVDRQPARIASIADVPHTLSASEPDPALLDLE